MMNSTTTKRSLASIALDGFRHLGCPAALGLLIALAPGCGGGGSKDQGQATPKTQARAGFAYAGIGQGKLTLKIRQGGSVSLNPANDSWNGAEFTVDPSLPRGLELDKATGAIKGTAQEVAPETLYKVTASKGGQTSTVSLTIAVVDGREAPADSPEARIPQGVWNGTAILDGKSVKAEAWFLNHGEGASEAHVVLMKPGSTAVTHLLALTLQPNGTGSGNLIDHSEAGRSATVKPVACKLGAVTLEKGFSGTFTLEGSKTGSFDFKYGASNINQPIALSALAGRYEGHMNGADAALAVNPDGSFDLVVSKHDEFKGKLTQTSPNANVLQISYVKPGPTGPSKGLVVAYKESDAPLQLVVTLENGADFEIGRLKQVDPE